MLLVLGLWGCVPDVRPLYEEEKARAAITATDAPTQWEPDLVIGIGETALGHAVDAAGTEALERSSKLLSLSLPLGAAVQLKPKLRVTRAELEPGEGCESCLHFDLDIRGEVKWSLGLLGGSFPVRVEVGGQLKLVVENGTRVVARPFRLGKVVIAGGDFGALRVDPSALLQDYVRAAIGEALPPVPLVDLAESGLPIRLVRIRNGIDAVRIEVLTDVPGALPAIAPNPGREGIIVGISETALAGLLRREAFASGLHEMNIAVDPRAVTVDGDRFGLALRIWRLEGQGWWRDYDVQGTLAIENGKLHLRTDERLVKQVGASPGAGLVDPLAALFQAKILEAIATNLDRTLPAAHKESLGVVGLQATATQVSGLAHTLLLGGELRVVRARE
ncbi:MAG: hypothetical protein EXR71_05235 [Myxococcales bacterium]|nr:hypothetical protein [Myxococcales bacterium]